MNQQPPVYGDYLTIEGEEAEIGILTSNPHATFLSKEIQQLELILPFMIIL